MFIKKEKILNTLEYIDSLKRKNSLEVVDVHTHPLDVMGTVHPSEYKKENTSKKHGYLDGSILEFFQYGKIVSLVSPLYYKLVPASVHNIIKDTYLNTDSGKFLNEIAFNHIDKSVLIPIDPWVSLEKIREVYQDDHFYFLYSPNIHEKSSTQLVDEIIAAKKNGCIGIKMHPNLQGFQPQPSKNNKKIEKKLLDIYSTAQSEKLLLLFHGGKSFYVDSVNPKYQNIPRGRYNALLKNYVNKDGSSEIFDNYTIPIIIAHLGHFGVLRANFKLMQRIANKHKNVYFDTSGCSPRRIKRTIDILTSDRILFGTDCIYNKMAYGIHFVFIAAQKTSSKETFDDILINIFGKNFSNVLKQL